MSVNPIISKVFKIDNVYYNPLAAAIGITKFRSYLKVIAYQEPDGLNVLYSSDNENWSKEESWVSYQDISGLYDELQEPIHYNRLSKVE